MKTLQMVASMAALLAVACNTSFDQVVDTPTLRTITVSASPQSRSAIGDYDPVAGSYSFKWLDTDRLVISENSESAISDCAAINSDGKASFSAQFTIANASQYTYGAISPATAYSNNCIAIPALQYPTADSFDAAADILIAEPQTFDAPQNALQFRFARITAPIKLQFKDLSYTEDEKLLYITLSFPKSVCGNITTDIAAGTYNANLAEDGSQSVTACSATTQPDHIWLSVFPFALNAADEFTVEMRTSKYLYTKTYTVSKLLEFKRNNINLLTLNIANMAQTAATTYSAVTDSKQIADGSRLLFITAGKVVEGCTAISSTTVATNPDGSVSGDFAVYEFVVGTATVENVSGYTLYSTNDKGNIQKKSVTAGIQVATSETKYMIWTPCNVSNNDADIVAIQNAYSTLYYIAIDKTGEQLQCSKLPIPSEQIINIYQLN